ncbi:MAG: LytR/AlgR family response regulator transcription factor [Christensenellales bacterium]|jgi:two-component system LytT family response regulator
MEPVRIVIADDDEGMRLVMRKIVAKAEGYVLVGEAKDGNELMALYDEKKPQVVVLDVEMPFMTGVECARAIQDRNPRTILIFATAHEQYMSDAFSVYAFDYLVKPFKVERALETLRLARQRISESGHDIKPTDATRGEAKRIMIRQKDSVSLLDLSRLLLVQREDRSTVLYAMDGQRFVTGEALGELEARLPKADFFRCHKSYIININHIDTISPYGRWTYIVTLRGTEHDALITYEKFEELQKRFA